MKIKNFKYMYTELKYECCGYTRDRKVFIILLGCIVLIFLNHCGSCVGNCCTIYMYNVCLKDVIIILNFVRCLSWKLFGSYFTHENSHLKLSKN